jgi:DNA-binding CsgD family transcriptional regulator
VPGGPGLDRRGKHDPRRAAILLGAAESLAQTMGAPTAAFPDLLTYHDQCERQIRRELGEKEFQAVFQHGKGLSFEDASTYALNEKPQAVAAPPAVAETTLTRRERQVADLIAQGLTNKEIAARLVIAQRTAEAHVERILTKLGLTTRTQIALWIAQRAEPRIAVVACRDPRVEAARIYYVPADVWARRAISTSVDVFLLVGDVANQVRRRY